MQYAWSAIEAAALQTCFCGKVQARHPPLNYCCTFSLATALSLAEVPYFLCLSSCSHISQCYITCCSAQLLTVADRGACQGIHNFIVHYLKSRRPDMLHFEAVLLSNDDSPIYTLGVITPPKIEVSEDGFAVYNRKGNRAPIVHQIDRHWQLNNHLDFLSQERLKRRLMEKA